MAGVFRDLFSKPPGIAAADTPVGQERQKALQETGEIPGGQGGFQHRFCLGLCEAKRRRQLRGKVRRVSAGLKNDAIVYGLLHVRGHIPDHIFTHAPCTAGAFGQSLRIAAADAPLRQERQETLQDGGADLAGDGRFPGGIEDPDVGVIQ